ncbi:unnamed protein product [Phytophthora fragariaefolia]|uniref:Unnamed protein product n=1 Tax=Phytophthora fragariaefolia TaxID=1490495 RepID=A0A9W6TVI2_9STRA|nr:unnamed protein product [Phytophthora fragariaefolia]
MKPAERNYPVHDKELLAMRYALIKFTVYLLGEQTFALYTDHASLRTATKSLHLSLRMARWLSFFAEYNFVVHYKSGKNNIPADALSRRPDYDPRVVLGSQVIDDEDESDDHCAVCAAVGINPTSVSPEMDLRDEIVAVYADDAVYDNILAYLRSPSDGTLGALSRNTRNQIDGTISTATCCATTSIVSMLAKSSCPTTTICGLVSIHEFHDSPIGAHLGREKTFAAMVRDFYWPRMDKWIQKWVRTCEICQRAAHPETDGQTETERVNRVLEDVIRSYATSFTSWSKVLPLAEFSLNNAEHASTGVTPFFANNARHTRVSALLAVGQPTVYSAPTLGGNDDDDDNGVDDVVTAGVHALKS